MGSFFEMNDTLQITREQGFPKELDIEKHLKNSYNLKDFDGKIFEFKDKLDLRLYQVPPTRNFFVENRDGKWIYWGLCHILETKHDNIKKTTSGKFKIIYINTSEEMKQAYKLTDQRPGFNYFNQ